MTEQHPAGDAASSEAPKKVLVVDDERDIVEPIRHAFEKEGFRVFTAHDGNAALDLAEREDPDIVILDVMMPLRSGFLVLERLRVTQLNPSKVIMITANEGKRHEQYAREKLGADAYFHKGTFHPTHLVQKAQELLGNS